MESTPQGVERAGAGGAGVLSDDDVTRLRIAFARIARVLAKQVGGDGLTQTQLSVLGTVVRDGPVGLGELAEFEGINPTMLSRVIGKLDGFGLIQRNCDPGDRRAALVEATEEGKRVQRESRARRSALLTDRLTGLTPDQLTALRAALPALEALADGLGPRSATRRAGA